MLSGPGFIPCYQSAALQSGARPRLPGECSTGCRPLLQSRLQMIMTAPRETLDPGLIRTRANHASSLSGWLMQRSLTGGCCVSFYQFSLDGAAVCSVWVLESDCDLVHPAWRPVATVQRTLGPPSANQGTVSSLSWPIRAQSLSLTRSISSVTNVQWHLITFRHISYTIVHKSHIHVSIYSLNTKLLTKISKPCGLIF